MRINLAVTPAWTAGEIRSLFARNVVYAGSLIAVSFIGMAVAKVALQPKGVMPSLERSTSPEILSRCRSELEALERQRQWLLASKRSRARSVEMLRTFERVTPPDAWLTELTVRDDGMSVVGLSRSDSSVSKLLEDLSSIPGISRARLESSRLVPHPPGDAREFRISGDHATDEGE